MRSHLVRRRCRKFLNLLLSSILVVLSSPGYAELVRDLYEAEVPVADHGKQALAVASRDALSEVFVKVSGSTDVLQNPAIVSELSRARGYVQQYSYTRDEDAEGDLSAKFEFDGSVVSRLVTGSGAPLWTANRPPVLVWIVAQEAGRRQFLTRDLAPEILTSIQQEFARRGVPVRFPLYDLQDAASLSVDQAWRLQAPPLYTASERYGVQDILAGRLTGLSTGEWVGGWAYLSSANRIDRSVTAESVEVFMVQGVALVAEEMAERYAVATSGSDVGGITMSVIGVDSYNDYGKIVTWLESLELIQHANVETIRGSEIQLRLIAQADARQLKTTIELNKRLVPVSSGMGIDQLSYQWQK